jgi:hypothetical protein
MITSAILFYVFFAIPLATASYFIARALAQPRVLWVVLSLVPAINILFAWFLGTAVVLAIMRALKDIESRKGGR